MLTVAGTGCVVGDQAPRVGRATCTFGDFESQAREFDFGNREAKQILFFFLGFHLFIFRERGREGERGEKH